jgi:hypothetical protein
MPTSYNGWTVLNWGDPAIDPNFSVAGHKFPAGVLRGPVSTVLKYVGEEMNKRVESIEPDQDEWGHDYRLNRNANNWSCHASATAIDYNALRHGNSARGTFSGAQVAEIHKILAEVSNVVRWGGDFSGTVDEMHFEINANDTAVAMVAAGLTGTPLPKDDTMALFDVVRVGETDYLLTDNKIVLVETPKAYEYYYTYLKVIDIPHGQARQVPADVLDWYAEKVRAWGGVADVPKA